MKLWYMPVILVLVLFFVLIVGSEGVDGLFIFVTLCFLIGLPLLGIKLYFKEEDKKLNAAKKEREEWWNHGRFHGEPSPSERSKRNKSDK